VGLSARRIYQDVVEQNGFNDSYQSVHNGIGFTLKNRP
jgi:hypothetical protein